MIGWRKKPTVVECSWKTELDFPAAAKRLAEAMSQASFFTNQPMNVSAAMTRLAAASVSSTQALDAARGVLALGTARPPVDPRLVRWVEKL